jgi:2-methylcitrate dehydratase PrpD
MSLAQFSVCTRASPISTARFLLLRLQSSPLASLLSQAQREAVADAVNAALLAAGSARSGAGGAPLTVRAGLGEGLDKWVGDAAPLLTVGVTG